jgi:hypothetical protein
MRRVGRPPLGGAARQLIAIRVDPDVLERFRQEARRRKVGYQTLINEVLAEHAGPPSRFGAAGQRMSHDPAFALGRGRPGFALRACLRYGEAGSHDSPPDTPSPLARPG